MSGQHAGAKSNTPNLLLSSTLDDDLEISSKDAYTPRYHTYLDDLKYKINYEYRPFLCAKSRGFRKKFSELRAGKKINYFLTMVD